MISPLNQVKDLSDLESRLQTTKALHQRLALIDSLAAHYVFTNIHRAQELLLEMKQILDKEDYPDLLLNYHFYMGQVENQLYHYSLSEEHFQEAIELVEERGDVKQQADIYIDFAGTCINHKRMEQAEAHLQKAERLLRVFPNERLQARIICREGFVQLHFANYSRAIELLLEADKQIHDLGPEALTLKDYYFLQLIQSGLGNVYENNNDQQKSAEAYKKAVEIAVAMGMTTRLSWHFLLLGKSYMALEDLAKAEYYFEKAISAQEDPNPIAKAGALANLGYCQLRKLEYTEALKLLAESEAAYRENAEISKSNLAMIESWRGEVFYEMEKTAKARTHLFRALRLAKSAKDYKQLSGICQMIAIFYAVQEDFKSAYEYQNLQSKYAEEYVRQVNARKQWEMEAKYEAEKKKQEAELLRLQATRLQLKALRAQMNPHFMYNALNSIQNYITSNEMNYAAKYLAKFAKLMRQSLEYSELEIISLEKELEFLEDYLYINEKLRFEDRLDYAVVVDDDLEEDILGVPTMIVQPYVENALEHGLRSRKNGHIRVHFSLHDEDTILCVVEDNGIGRERARQLQSLDQKYQNHKSRGTNITEQRLQLLNNTKEKAVYVTTIDLKDPVSNQPIGTRVEILIPIMEVQIK